jgi:hypothetical protein
MSKSGDDDEKLVQAWLERDGYLVHRAAAAGRIKIGPRWVQKSHDLFGAIDLLAIKRDRTVAFQVTTKTNRSARRKKVAAHAAHWPYAWQIGVVVHDWKRVGTRTRHYLSIEYLLEDGKWTVPIALGFDKDELLAWKKSRAPVTLAVPTKPRKVKPFGDSSLA